MQRTLEKFGYEVVLAEDGRAAVEILSQPDGPRLALIDWMMPKLDGLGLCREVRRTQRDGAYVYILLLTSRQDAEDVVAGLEAGADDYITKPFHPAVLRARLHTGRRILSLEETLVQAREEMRFKATHDALTSLWNRASILSMARSELRRSAREARPFSLLLCDIDHFKRVNDDHGHLVGDFVLEEVARRLTAAVRDYRRCGRSLWRRGVPDRPRQQLRRGWSQDTRRAYSCRHRIHADPSRRRRAFGLNQYRCNDILPFDGRCSVGIPTRPNRCGALSCQSPGPQPRGICSFSA